MTLRLTNELPDLRISKGEKERIYWDSHFLGFGLRVRWPISTFIFQYRVAGRTRRLKIADASIISLAGARAIAKRLYIGVKIYGRDPQGERFAMREERKFLHLSEKEVVRLQTALNKIRNQINERHARTTQQNAVDLETS